jgi:hypothetical protein
MSLHQFVKQQSLNILYNLDFVLASQAMQKKKMFFLQTHDKGVKK